MWIKVGIDIDGEDSDDRSGYSVSINSDGTIVAIGAYRNDGSNGTDSGHVRVYQIDEILAREWDSNTPLAELVIDFGDNNNKQLTRYNIWATTSNNNGAPTKWTLEGSNDATNWSILDERDNQTIWPTIDGIIASDSLHESNAYYIPKGHVRVYNFSSGGWLLLGDDIDNNIYANESYSKSIDISGDGNKLVIGIPTYNNGYGRVETRSFVNDGSYNIFIGYEVGYSNTLGLSNVYIGYQSGYSNTTGSNNIGIGQENLLYNTTGSNNTAIGFKSSYSNTIGFQNVSLGKESLYSNTTGNSNTAIGFQSLYNANINGNTAIGTKCLSQTSLTNIQLTDIDTYNVGIGTECSLQLVGKGNTAIGTQCLASDFTYASINTTNDSMFIEPIYFILSGSANLYGTSSISDTIKLNSASSYQTGLAKIKVSKNSTSLDTGNYSIKFDFKMTVESPTENYFYIIIGSKRILNNQERYNSELTSPWFFQNNGTDPKEGIFNGIVIMFKTLTTTDSILVYYDNNSTSRAIISEASTSGSINFGTDTFRSYTLSYVSSTKLLTLTDGIFTKTYSFNGITNINDDYITFGSSTHHTGTNSDNYINNIKFSLSLVNSTNNTAIGFKNLFNNASGELNTAIGSESLYSNKSGYNNVSIGSNTLHNNNSGYENTSIGYNSSFKNTDGHNNITIGTNVSYNNRSGNNNVICGNDSNFKSEYNSNNIIYGNNNLYNAKGGFNTIIGNENVYNSKYYIYGTTNTITSNTLVLDSETYRSITSNDNRYKIYIGWKICITNGSAAGITRTITDMSYSNPLYTITVDSAFPPFSEIGYRYYKLNITRPINDGSFLSFSELALYDENDNLIIGAGISHTSAGATLSGTVQHTVGDLAGVFDNIITGANNTYFHEGLSDTPATGYIQIDFGSSVTKKVGMYRIWARPLNNTDQAPKDWTLEASNDGTNWDILDRRAGITTWPAVSGTNASTNINQANEFRKIKNGSEPINYKLYFDLYNSIKNDMDIEFGYITASSNNTITLKRQSSLINDHYSYQRYYVKIIDSSVSSDIGQIRLISDYNSSTNVISVTPNWNSNPAVNAKYRIFILLEFLHSYEVSGTSTQDSFGTVYYYGNRGQRYEGSDLLFVKNNSNTISNYGKLNRIINTGVAGSGGTFQTIYVEFPFETLPESGDRAIFYDEKISEYNVLIGYKNSNNEIDGKYNIAIGNENLANNCNSIQNIVIGNFSLFNINYSLNKIYDKYSWTSKNDDLSLGGFNIGLGLFSSFHNTIGKNNISIGTESLYNNQKGDNNIALGYKALKGFIGEKGTSSYPKGRLITPTASNQNDAFISPMFSNSLNYGTLNSTVSEFKYAGNTTSTDTDNYSYGGVSDYYIRLTPAGDNKNGIFWNDKYRYYNNFPDTFLLEFDSFMGGSNDPGGNGMEIYIGDKYLPPYDNDYVETVNYRKWVNNGYFINFVSYYYPGADNPYSDHALEIWYSINNDITSNYPWGYNHVNDTGNTSLKKKQLLIRKKVEGDESSDEYYSHKRGWDNDTWQTIKILFNRGEFTILKDNYILCKYVDEEYLSRNLSGATDRPYIWWRGSTGAADHVHLIKNIKFSENISNLDVNPYNNVSALGPHAGNFNYDTLINTPIVDYDVFIGGGEGDNYQLIHANCNNTSRNWSPAVNNAVDLGTSTKAWKNAYIAGNVGIGTTNPTYNLDLYDGNFRLLYRNDSSVYNNFLTFERTADDCRINHYCDNEISARIEFNGYSTIPQSTIEFYTKENGANLDRRMIINYNGNVGIGTTNPGEKLHVNGNIKAGGDITVVGNTNYGNSTRQMITLWDPDYGIGVQASTAYFRSGADFQFYKGGSHSDSQGNAGVGGVSLFTIKNTGNVGIGTTNPQKKLHIKQSLEYSTNNFPGDAIRIEKSNNAALYWDIGIDSDSSGNELSFVNDNGSGGYINGGVTGYNNSMNFTGQHRCILNKNIDENSVGLIVSSSGKYININNSLHTNINESLPICSITNIDNDIKVFGIISDKEDTNSDRTYETGAFVTPYEKTNKNEQRMFINSLGEGAVWVCNKNGNLVNGDYISSSSVPGYGMKQILQEGTLKNYTVAKITCNCDFSLTKIVKQKLKLITTTETYEENVFEEIYKTNTENVIEYDEELSRYVQKEVTTTITEKEQVYDTVDLYNESGEVIGTHKIERKETKTKTVTEIDYDENGDVQYEDDLDENGNQQMIYPYDTRFLLPDATQITEEEYNTKIAAEEEVYIACFVGCTYHCG